MRTLKEQFSQKLFFHYLLNVMSIFELIKNKKNDVHIFLYSLATVNDFKLIYIRHFGKTSSASVILAQTLH